MGGTRQRPPPPGTEPSRSAAGSHLPGRAGHGGALEARGDRRPRRPPPARGLGRRRALPRLPRMGLPAPRPHTARAHRSRARADRGRGRAAARVGGRAAGGAGRAMTGALWPATPPARGRGGMVATSQRPTTEVGVEVLRRGGNAVDAAVTCGAVLSVVEPMATGLGGDLFAIVHGPAGPEGLDAAGPAPGEADPDAPVAPRGPRSVTVPGAASGWAALLDRHGTWGLDACLAPAIDVAEGGFSLGANAARIWGEAVSVPAPFVPTPRAGKPVPLPALAGSLRAVAAEGPAAIYTGPIAEAIAAACWLTEDDLAGYRSRRVAPLRLAW